jgi:ferric enterobactin receptor
MKKLLLVVLAFLFYFSVSAQFPGGGAGVQAGKRPNLPNLGHVSGKVVDNTGKPVADASVLILQSKYDTATKKMKDVLVKGLTTDNKGEFDVSELPLMGVKIKISTTGFKELTQPVQFLDPSKMPKPGQGASGGAPYFPTSFDKDLGKLQLTADAAQLQAVTVTSSAPTLKMDIDKKVFNVEKNIVSAGGTAVDVMRNVPSLQVDIDGNVKLRNAAPQIYVDGKPTTLSLDQIPSDAIQSVEVITNPSAKYDASGGNAGILNIVLKKNKKTGYNGNIMAGVDSRGGGNFGGNFNVRQGKVNLSAAVMANARKDKATSTIDRQNLGDDPTNVYQNGFNKNNGAFMFGRLGLDYFVTNKTTLSISGIKVHGDFKPNATTDITTDSLFNNGDIKNSDYSQRFTNGQRTFNATGLQAGMVHNFARDGQQWTADLNYFGGKNTGNSLYTTNYYDGSAISGTQLQRVISDGTNQFLTLQTDYTQPFGKNTKLETGIRAQLRQLTNNNATYIGPTEAEFVKIPTGSTNYKNHDNVYAAYVSLKSAIKNFGYEVGLRAESSDYKGELTNTGETFSNKYPISLFPSVFLSQKLKNNQELQASITRRVNRPNFFQLIPYTDYTDSLNITKGNPALKPEFTSSIEMSYGKTFKNSNNILASIYYKHTTDMITSNLQEDQNPVTGQDELIKTYINANSSYSYGAEFTSVNKITKWWDATANVNIYNSKINTDNIANSITQEAMWSWFGKLNNNFKLPNNFAIQLSADYQSKTNLPINNSSGQPGPPMMQAQSSSQGYIRAFWGTDIAVRKSFLKNNAAMVSVSVNDIFRTRKQDQYSYSQYFVQDYYRLNNPQLVRINFTYRFGKMDFSLFKRTNTKSQGEGMQGATQGMQ